MGESRRVAWDHPATLPMPGRSAEPTGRERMLWEAMLRLAPTMYAEMENEVYPTIAVAVREMANALVREWEAQCRPSN
jgi:hypothetical protein